MFFKRYLKNYYLINNCMKEELLEMLDKVEGLNNETLDRLEQIKETLEKIKEFYNS